MQNLKASDVRTFVPAKDFELSKEFYVALGWKVEWSDDELALLELAGCRFYLQRYFVKEWAENFMMQLMVDDLDAWWAHIQSLDLAGQFGVAAPRPPAMQSWGLRVAYVVDPSGVLWHVAQRRENAVQDQ